MSLVFNFDWASTDDAVIAEELRVTSSILEIWVDGECVTKSYDTTSRDVRRSIAVAMYPAAEWIAFDWWLLTRNGRAAPQRHPSERDSRRSLTSAGDGYAWPDLIILPQGELAELRWRPRHPVATDIAFATGGHRVVPRADMQASLANVVERVLAHLEERGVRGTPLQEEWARRTALDHEEAEPDP